METGEIVIEAVTVTEAPWGAVQPEIMEALAKEPHDIAEVVRLLTDLDHLLERANPGVPDNAVLDFNRLYRTITAEILERHQAGAFADPTFLSLLDVEFAKRYLNALRLYGQGSADTPQAWKVLFDRLHERSHHPLPAAAAGVNAHVNYDLPFALLSTWDTLGSTPEDDRQHGDYLLINEVFFTKIPGLRRSYLKTWQLFFDRLNGTIDDWCEDRVVEFARDLAWTDAKRFWPFRHDPTALQEARRTLDHHVAFVGWALLSPACWFLQ